MRLTKFAAKLFLLTLSLAWKLYSQSGRFEGVCPRCGAIVCVPRGKTNIALFGQPLTAWCDVCGNMGDCARVPVKRTAWLF